MNVDKIKQTRQPFQELAVVAGTPGQFVRLTCLETFQVGTSAGFSLTWITVWLEIRS